MEQLSLPMFSAERPAEPRQFGWTVNPSYSEIPTAVWVHLLDENGRETRYVGRKCGRPVGEVVRDLAQAMDAMIDDHMSVGLAFSYDKETYPQGRETECPEYHNIACYAVTGGSEGHWIHVDLIFSAAGRSMTQQSVTIAMIKTFNGREYAQKLAARCAELLGA